MEEPQVTVNAFLGNMEIASLSADGMRYIKKAVTLEMPGTESQICRFIAICLCIYFFKKVFLFFLLWLINNILSISAIQQSDPVMHIYVHSFLCTCFLTTVFLFFSICKCAITSWGCDEDAVSQYMSVQACQACTQLYWVSFLFLKARCILD